MQNCTSSQGGINTRRRIDSTSSASSDSIDSSIRSITPPSFSEFEESDLAEPESLDDDCQGMDSFHDQTTLSPDDNHNQNVNTSNSQNVNMDSSVHAPPLDYKLIGDNLDKNIQARYIRLESHQNKSLHLFHLCAVRDRIDFSKIPNHHAIKISEQSAHLWQ